MVNLFAILLRFEENGVHPDGLKSMEAPTVNLGGLCLLLLPPLDVRQGKAPFISFGCD